MAGHQTTETTGHRNTGSLTEIGGKEEERMKTMIFFKLPFKCLLNKKKKKGPKPS